MPMMPIGVKIFFWQLTSFTTNTNIITIMKLSNFSKLVRQKHNVEYYIMYQFNLPRRRKQILHMIMDDT